MGLETAELFREVETTFGVSLRDVDPGDVQTAGQLLDCVLARHAADRAAGARAKRHHTHLDAVVLHKLRHALVEVTGIDRGAAQAAARLAELLPRSSRRDAWPRLAAAAQLELPALARPKGLSILLFLSWGVGVFAIDQFLDRVMIPVAAFFVSLLAGSLAAGCAYLATRPLATGFPADARTLADLAQTVMAHNYHDLVERYGVWDADDVWHTLQVIVAAHRDIMPHEVSRDTFLDYDVEID